MELKVNETLRKAVPELKIAKYESLKQNIKEKGQIVPIQVMEDGTIIDGYHRYKICRELNIEPQYVVMKNIKTIQDALSHSFEQNFQRRQCGAFEATEWARNVVEYSTKNTRELGNALGLDYTTIAKIDAILDRKDYPQESRKKLRIEELDWFPEYNKIVTVRKAEEAISNIPANEPFKQQIKTELKTELAKEEWNKKQLDSVLERTLDYLGQLPQVSEFEKKVVPHVTALNQLESEFTEITTEESTDEATGQVTWKCIVKFPVKR